MTILSRLNVGLPRTSQLADADVQEAAEGLPLKKFPWGTVAANVGGIAAAHAAGYLGAGALTDALMKTRLAPTLAKMDPMKRRLLVGQLISASGAVMTIAGSLAHTAAKARTLEAIQRAKEEHAEAVKTQEKLVGEKTAAVLDAYAYVLSRR